MMHQGQYGLMILILMMLCFQQFVMCVCHHQMFISQPHVVFLHRHELLYQILSVVFLARELILESQIFTRQALVQSVESVGHFLRPVRLSLELFGLFNPRRGAVVGFILFFLELRLNVVESRAKGPKQVFFLFLKNPRRSFLDLRDARLDFPMDATDVVHF